MARDDVRKLAIVTTPGNRGQHSATRPTLEEHKRRGDTAEVLFREIVRRATEE